MNGPTPSKTRTREVECQLGVMLAARDIRCAMRAFLSLLWGGAAPPSPTFSGPRISRFPTRGVTRALHSILGLLTARGR